MKIKRSLAGYNRKTVDGLIKEYEEKLQRLNDDNEYLKEKLDETILEYQTAKKEYEKQIDELLEKESRSNMEIHTENALNATKSLMRNTVTSIGLARKEYEEAIDMVENDQQIFEDKFYELVELIGNMQAHIKDLGEKAAGIRSTARSFDRITQEVTDQFEKNTRYFIKRTGHVTQAIKENRNKISFVEFLDNYNGEGNIVEIIRLYYELYR